MITFNSRLASKVAKILLAALLTGLAAFFFGFATTLFDASRILLIAAFALAMVLFWRWPFYGLLAFIFLIPSEAILLTSGGATINRLLGMGVGAIWFLTLLAQRRRMIFRKRIWPYLLFLAWAILSILWADYPSAGVQFVFTYGQLAVLLVILLDQVRSLARLKQAIIALCAGGIFEIGLFYLVGNFSERGRLMLAPTGGAGLAIYGYPLAYSMTMLGVLGILGKWKYGWVGILGYLAGLYPLIGTGLRGGLAATVAGIGAAAMVVARKRRSVVLIAVLAVGALLYSIQFLSEQGFLPQALMDRLTVSSAVETGGSSRVDIWKLTLSVIPERPIFGLGLNQFGVYVYRHNLYGTEVGVHNDYLETMVNLGAIGALLLVGGEIACIFYLIQALRYVRKEDVVWYGILVALLAASIVGQNFVNQIAWKYVWVIRTVAIAGSYPSMWRKEPISTEAELRQP